MGKAGNYRWLGIALLGAVCFSCTSREEQIRQHHTKGIQFYQSGKIKLAQTQFEKIIDLDPKHSEAWMWRGSCLVEQGQAGKGIMDFTKAITLREEFRQAYFRRGIAFQSLERWEKALLDLETALRIDNQLIPDPPNKEILFPLGQVSLKLDALDGAVTYLTRTIAQNPEHGEAYFLRGNAYDMQGKDHAALDSYRRAVKYSPHEGFYYITLGNQLLGLDRPEEACKNFELALEKGYLDAQKFITQNCQEN